MNEDVAALRRRSRACWDQAQAMNNDELRATLIEIGNEYEARAVELERSQRGAAGPNDKLGLLNT